MIKRLITLFLFMLMIVSATGCIKKEPLTTLEQIKQRDKIIIGTKFDSRPFGYIDENQQLKGFEIDLGRKIAKEILGDENKVEFKQVLSSNRILALSSGEVDILLATVSITDQRKKVIEFSDPYFTTGLAILTQKDSTIKDIKDLNNRPVILILGTTGEKEIRTLAPEAKLYGFRTYTDGYSALKAGRAEALITDKSILMGIALNDPGFKLLPQTYTVEHYGIGLKKCTDSDSLKIEINNILKKLQQNGEMRELFKKWNIS